MDMHVVLGVDVIERQSRGAKGFELGANLRFQLRPNARVKEEPHAGAYEILRERSVTIHEIGNVPRRENRTTVDDDHVQADAKRWHGASSRHGIVRRRGADHEAGGAEDSFAVSALDRLVDGARKAEVVSGDDDLSHGLGMPSLTGVASEDRSRPSYSARGRREAWPARHRQRCGNRRNLHAPSRDTAAW